MRAKDFINEADLGTNPKRPSRKGSRPERGHTPVKRYRNQDDEIMKRGDELGYADRSADLDAGEYAKKEDMELDERGKASRALCLGSKPDADLGASQLASCKSQGLRARDGEKSHKLGKSKSSRIKMGGKKLKGKKYGGPLPDWGTRK